LKKIIFSSNTAWYLYNFRLDLIKELAKSNEIFIIAPRDDNYFNKLKLFGKCYDIELDVGGSNPVNDLKLIYSFLKLFKKIKPDLVVLYTIKPNIYGGLAAKMLNIQTLNVIAGLGTVFLNDRLTSKIARWLYKVSCKNNIVLFENKEDSKKFLKEKLVKSEQVELVPGSGIDVNKFAPKSNKISKNKNLIFLFIARLIKDKGILEYVEAARIVKNKYPNVHFKILGSYYEDNPTAISKEQMKQWLAEGIIEYLGYTDAVIEEIEKADCIVLPSYREGLSRVLLEAASMSKPIITSNVTGCKEVVDDGENGFLAKVKDSRSVAEAMEKIINLSQNERNIMGEKGREKIKKEFDNEIVIKKYLCIIRKMMQ